MKLSLESYPDYAVLRLARHAADERLDLLKNISAAGAPFLTLKMLDQAQPKVDEDI